jgi:hypothetical protein
MKVRLVHDISGTRDGKAWPAAGEEVDLPDAEALSMLQNGSARAVSEKPSERGVELRDVVDEDTAAGIKARTTTRERQSRAKRAHEPMNLGAAADEQPAEDDNGPRAPEVAAEASAKVEDPSQATQSDEGPMGDTVKTSDLVSDSKSSSKK